MPKVAANFTAADLKPLESATTKESAQAILHAIVDKAAEGDYAIKTDKVAVLHRNINNTTFSNIFYQFGKIPQKSYIIYTCLTNC